MKHFDQKKIPIDYLINPGDPIPDHYWSWVPACWQSFSGCAFGQRCPRHQQLDGGPGDGLLDEELNCLRPSRLLLWMSCAPREEPPSTLWILWGGSWIMIIVIMIMIRIVETVTFAGEKKSMSEWGKGTNLFFRNPAFCPLAFACPLMAQPPHTLQVNLNIQKGHQLIIVVSDPDLDSYLSFFSGGLCGEKGNSSYTW